MTSLSICDAALAWAAKGMRVFPLAPGDKVPLSGVSPTRHATTNADIIRGWWRDTPTANFGVLAGDGLLVVDVDTAKGGDIYDLSLPNTLTVQTPSGGYHLYFSGPDVANSVSRVAPGVDVRSTHGYVVGPGSYFADPGQRKGYTGHYSVVIDTPMAEAPHDFVVSCGLPPQKASGPALAEDHPDDVIYAIHYLLRDATPGVRGLGRKNTVYAVAARLRDLGISPERSYQLLAENYNERCEPPLEPDELLTIVENAAKYAQNQQGIASPSVLAAQFEDVVVPPTGPSPSRFATVFADQRLIPAEDLPPHDWIMHRVLLRNEATVLAGPGGASKSAMAISIAAHLAAGRSFGGYHVNRPAKTLIYNLEDTREELHARAHAACAIHGISTAEFERSVLLWSGRTEKFRLMGRRSERLTADIQEVVRLSKLAGFDVIVLDPFVSLHSEDENDNVAMGEVMDAATDLAALSGTAVLLAQHTPKGVRQTGSHEAVRGAGNIVNRARLAVTLYPADEADATVYGLGPNYRSNFVRLDDAKIQNDALSTKPAWFERVSFVLPSGRNSYAVRPIDIGVNAAGQGEMIARIAIAHFDEHAVGSMTTFAAAKVLLDAEPTLFRETAEPGLGERALTLRVQTLLEQRLAGGVRVDNRLVKTVSRTHEGKTQRFVEVD